MKQKIEWYREVLELEPGSRVFFPLAKLLAADGQTHDAIITLRQGVFRHPGHVEARLLLVELLAVEGNQTDLAVEVERLGGLLSDYPGFWSSWSAILAKNPATQDASLALRFFAAALAGKPITWTSVIEQGLSSLLDGQFENTVAVPALKLEPALPTKQNVTEPSATEEETGKAIPLLEEAAEAESKKYAEEERVPAIAEEDALSERLASAEPDEEDEESEETFSLRTRSMAEVLAEQGDMSGALDIYQELIAAASPDERVSLEARADELARRMKAGTPQEETKAEKSASLAEGNRLVALLDSLAQRLEARAR